MVKMTDSMESFEAYFNAPLKEIRKAWQKDNNGDPKGWEDAIWP